MLQGKKAAQNLSWPVLFQERSNFNQKIYQIQFFIALIKMPSNCKIIAYKYYLKNSFKNRFIHIHTQTQTQIFQQT